MSIRLREAVERYLTNTVDDDQDYPDIWELKEALRESNKPVMSQITVTNPVDPDTSVLRNNSYTVTRDRVYWVRETQVVKAVSEDAAEDVFLNEFDPELVVSGPWSGGGEQISTPIEVTLLNAECNPVDPSGADNPECRHCHLPIYDKANDGAWVDASGGDVCCADKFTEDGVNGSHEPVESKAVNTISLVWSVEDVHEVRPHLSPDEAMEVLLEVKRRHDASIGVNWDTLRDTADDLYPH